MPNVTNKSPKKTTAKQILDRVMPNRYESERSLLACILSNPEFALKSVSRLTEDDFYTQSHKYIIEAMHGVVDNNKTIDVSTVLDKLEVSEKLELAGGSDYVIGLTEIWTPSSQQQTYFDTVKRCSQLRKLIETCTGIISQAYNSEDDESTIAQAEQDIFNISDRNRIGDISNLADSTYDVMLAFDEAHKNKGKITGVSTGIYGIDSRTNGFKPGNLVILAAGTSVGKSSLAMNIVEYAAKQGKKCAVFSLEMSKTEIASRMVCSISGVPSKRATDGLLSEDDWPKINLAINAISKLQIYVDDSSNLTSADVLARCRRLAARRDKNGESGLDFIVIDYLQLMAPNDSNKNDSRQQQVAAITRNLKIMAKELRVPIMALSQLSREAAKRKEKEGREPILADLRESGAIEQDADIVMFLHRPDDADQEDDPVRDVELIIAKNRNGPLGKSQIKWLGEIVRFVNNKEEADRIMSGGPKPTVKTETAIVVEEDAPPPDEPPADELPY